MKDDITVTQRVAQLIIEKKSGIKIPSSPILNKNNTKTEKVVTPKQYQNDTTNKDSDIVDIKSIKATNDENIEPNKENPLIHNLVVDDIARKILKLYVKE